MKWYATVVIMLAFCTTNTTFGQKKSSYEYLIDCFKEATAEKGERTIEGIGEIEEVAVSSTKLEETGLLYFTIPANKRSKSFSKMAQLVANDFIKTWKNNSKIISNTKFENTNATIIELQLHILIEDIYMNIIIVNDGEKIYQIMCIRDTENNKDFKLLLDKIQDQSCL